MEILGIGPLELLFILIIALIILGPGDMVKAGRTLGRFLRQVVTSPEWRTVQKVSRELKYLPNRLMRDANLEELSKDFSDLNKIGKDLNNDVRQVQTDLTSWTTPPELMHLDEPVPDITALPGSDIGTTTAPEASPPIPPDPSTNPGTEDNTD
jgi:Sec-independent protein translocase protein TatA